MVDEVFSMEKIMIVVYFSRKIIVLILIEVSL